MSDSNLVTSAIESINKGQIAFVKFITANDTGATGGHQSGFYLHKSSYPLYFKEAGKRGENKNKYVTIKWQNDFETESRFIYYGQKSRNEYRLTRFGRGFPLLEDDNIGDLLVLTKQTDTYYHGFVISGDDNIDYLLNSFGLSPQETNRIIPKTRNLETEDNRLLQLFSEYILKLKVDFPPTEEVATNARDIIMRALNLSIADIHRDPDRELLRWIDTEYLLFKALENDRYSELIAIPFKDVDSFVQTANSILNRRKSRAGRSLEHHLTEVFVSFQLDFSSQVKTEGNKKPDFIFPSGKAYHDKNFPDNKLVFLGAKTTCKDRWRQILNEANRIKTKHLFTLQQGISSNQLTEMKNHNVQLVIPQQYKSAFPKNYRGTLLTLAEFVENTKTVQDHG